MMTLICSMLAATPMAALPVQAEISGYDTGDNSRFYIEQADGPEVEIPAGEKCQVMIKNEAPETPVTIHTADDDKGFYQVLLEGSNDNITIAANVNDNTSLKIEKNSGTVTLEKNSGSIDVSTGSSANGRSATLNVKGDAGNIAVGREANVTVNVAGNAEQILNRTNETNLWNRSTTINVGKQIRRIITSQSSGNTNISVGSIDIWDDIDTETKTVSVSNSGGTQTIHVENGIQGGNIVLNAEGSDQLENGGFAGNREKGSIRMTIGPRTNRCIPM